MGRRRPNWSWPSVPQGTFGPRPSGPLPSPSFAALWPNYRECGGTELTDHKFGDSMAP